MTVLADLGPWRQSINGALSSLRTNMFPADFMAFGPPPLAPKDPSVTPPGPSEDTGAHSDAEAVGKANVKALTLLLDTLQEQVDAAAKEVAHEAEIAKQKIQEVQDAVKKAFEDIDKAAAMVREGASNDILALRVLLKKLNDEITEKLEAAKTQVAIVETKAQEYAATLSKLAEKYKELAAGEKPGDDSSEGNKKETNGPGEQGGNNDGGQQPAPQPTPAPAPVPAATDPAATTPAATDPAGVQPAGFMPGGFPGGMPGAMPGFPSMGGMPGGMPGGLGGLSDPLSALTGLGQQPGDDGLGLKDDAVAPDDAAAKKVGLTEPGDGAGDDHGGDTEPANNKGETGEEDGDTKPASNEGQTPAPPATSTQVQLPDGQTTEARTPQSAEAVRSALAGASVSEAYQQAGVPLPPPGTPVTEPVPPTQLKAGDVGVWKDHMVMALGAGKVLVSGQTQPIDSVGSGPDFLGWIDPTASAGSPQQTV